MYSCFFSWKYIAVLKIIFSDVQLNKWLWRTASLSSSRGLTGSTIVAVAGRAGRGRACQEWRHAVLNHWTSAPHLANGISGSNLQTNFILEPVIRHVPGLSTPVYVAYSLEGLFSLSYVGLGVHQCLIINNTIILQQNHVPGYICLRFWTTLGLSSVFNVI